MISLVTAGWQVNDLLIVTGELNYANFSGTGFAEKIIKNLSDGVKFLMYDS